MRCEGRCGSSRRIQQNVLSSLTVGYIPVHLEETGCCFLGSLHEVAGCGHLIQQMSDQYQQALAPELEGQMAVAGLVLAAAVPGGLAEDPGNLGRISKGRIGGLVGALVRTGR